MHPYPDKLVTQIEDIPESEHYVILLNDGIYIPGDERSKTNPGHGYPSHTESYVTYEAYLTKDKLMSAIENLENPKCGNKRPYRVMKVTPIKVESKIVLNINE